MFYGVVKKSHLVDIAIAVCDVLGHGNGYAVPLLVETAAAETLLAQYRDPTEYSAGTGPTQVDEGTFIWLTEKYGGDHRHNEKLKKAFQVDLSKVRYDELEHSPLLGMIFTRLRYMTVADPVPTTIARRGTYWKKHYNSFHPNAAGSAEEYLEKCLKCGTTELLREFNPEAYT